MGVEDVQASLESKLWPNPVARGSNVNLNASGARTWTVFSSTGVQVAQGQAPASGTFMLPVGELPQGMYVIALGVPGVEGVNYVKLVVQ